MARGRFYSRMMYANNRRFIRGVSRDFRRYNVPVFSQLPIMALVSLLILTVWIPVVNVVVVAIVLIGLGIYYASNRPPAYTGRSSPLPAPRLPHHLINDPAHQEQKQRFEQIAGRSIDWREYALAINALSVAGYTWDWQTKSAKRF